MPIYKIADLNVLVEPKQDATLKRLRPYLTTEQSVDLEISLDPFADHSTSEQSEGIEIVNKLCRRIQEDFDGFFFHSSSLMLDGEAYVFTALSGTGKSTHTALWRKRFGDRVQMINDDKPIIRRHNGRFFIYGTPWMGKSEIGTNSKAEVKAVYVLERGEQNSVEEVTVGEVFKNLLQATLVQTDRENMLKLLGLFDEFFSTTRLFRLKCNTDISAVDVAYNAANSKKD